MITLTEKEIELIERHINNEIDLPKGETLNLFNQIIDKASKLQNELDAYDELDGDLIDWYYKKYKEQNANA